MRMNVKKQAIYRKVFKGSLSEGAWMARGSSFFSKAEKELTNTHEFLS